MYIVWTFRSGFLEGSVAPRAHSSSHRPMHTNSPHTIHACLSQWWVGATLPHPKHTPTHTQAHTTSHQPTPSLSYWQGYAGLDISLTTLASFGTWARFMPCLLGLHRGWVSDLLRSHTASSWRSVPGHSETLLGASEGSEEWGGSWCGDGSGGGVWCVCSAPMRL